MWAFRSSLREKRGRPRASERDEALLRRRIADPLLKGNPAAAVFGCQKEVDGDPCRRVQEFDLLGPADPFV